MAESTTVDKKRAGYKILVEPRLESAPGVVSCRGFDWRDRLCA